MSAVSSVLTTHLGNAAAGKDSPGSLAFHNSVLERKAFVESSLPSFAISRDLIMDSLAARVLHCLLRVSKCATLEDYCNRLESCDKTSSDTDAANEQSWHQLLVDAEMVYDTYASTQKVSELRTARYLADKGENEGDMVYEDALLFLRDGLHLEELFNAIKCGHSGRVLHILKLYALSFRGAGRPQYAHELLRIIHYCEVVWPPALR
jgi:hypothetical protein